MKEENGESYLYGFPSGLNFTGRFLALNRIGEDGANWTFSACSSLSSIATFRFNFLGLGLDFSGVARVGFPSPDTLNSRTELFSGVSGILMFLKIFLNRKI